MQKNSGTPLLRATKRGGPGYGGARTTIDQFGDSFPRLMDREAVARMSEPAPDKPH